MPIPENDLLTLTPEAMINLYVLDLNPIGVNFIFRFCNWTQTAGNQIIFQGLTYTALPIETSGFEINSRGQNPQPSITLSNVFGVVTALTIPNDDLIGATLQRKRTLAKYLDGMPAANPSMEFVPDIYTIWRKSQENELTVGFELRQFSDLGFRSKIPQRVIRKFNCVWQYRSAECGFAGGAIADENDSPVTSLPLDRCGKRLSSCKLRFGKYNQLPFGAFPGVDIV
jgi:lambda family phage minor tail protein L